MLAKAYPNSPTYAAQVRTLDRLNKAEGLLLRAREGLEAIEADGWLEGGKTRGEFKGMSEEEIARTVLADIKKGSE